MVWKCFASADRGIEMVREPSGIGTTVEPTQLYVVALSSMNVYRKDAVAGYVWPLEILSVSGLPAEMMRGSAIR